MKAKQAAKEANPDEEGLGPNDFLDLSCTHQATDMKFGLCIAWNISHGMRKRVASNYTMNTMSETDKNDAYRHIFN